MMRATDKDHIKKKPVVYREICQAAKTLGVDRSHLYRVLNGERQSRRIEQTEIYKKLKAGKYE